MQSMQTMIRGLAPAATAFLAALSLAAAAQVPAPQEGREYARIQPPIPIETGKKIEVIEFFSYACPHCADLEPVLQGWVKTLPADVQFRRVPVMFQEKWIPLAKVYYTLDALGEEARLSPEVFSAIHGNGMHLEQEKVFLDWAASKGLDRKKVEDMYNSFAIAGKMNRARQQAQSYNVQSVPLMFIDGKFVTASNRVGGAHAGMPPVLDALVAKARAERPKN
jgi:thiol:disulfide interchange protein DsbA